jgi:hypothetical protein
VAFLLLPSRLLLYHHNMTTTLPLTWTTSTAKVGDLLPRGWKRNPRYSTASTASALAAQLAEFGQYYEVLLDGNGIIDGHQRVAAWAKAYGKDFVVTVKTADRNLTEAEREIFTLRNHAGAMGSWDFEELGNWELDTLALGGFGEEMLEGLNQQQAFLMELLGKDGGDEAEQGAGDDGAEQGEETARATLAERFGVPPFSVLNAREGVWQDRKRAWIGLGIKSELGRGITNFGMAHPETTSTIDFYSQKRQLESELGHKISKDEAAELIAKHGRLKNARAANIARAQP